MARAVLAVALLAVLAVAGSAIVAPREEPGGRTVVASRAAGGASQLAAVVAPLRRIERPRMPCFREGSGPCVRVCTYLARSGQSITPGCPATAPTGCVHFIATRVGCAPSPSGRIVVPGARAIPPVARLRPRPKPGGP